MKKDMIDKEFYDRFKKILTAREAIEKDLKRKEAVGIIECPVCKEGKLHYRQASSNKHIWAKCSTEGCLEWIE